VKPALTAALRYACRFGLDGSEGLGLTFAHFVVRIALETLARRVQGGGNDFLGENWFHPRGCRVKKRYGLSWKANSHRFGTPGHRCLLGP
jgi:hypothetical protein